MHLFTGLHTVLSHTIYLTNKIKLDIFHVVCHEYLHYYSLVLDAFVSLSINGGCSQSDGLVLKGLSVWYLLVHLRKDFCKTGEMVTVVTYVLFFIVRLNPT